MPQASPGNDFGACLLRLRLSRKLSQKAVALEAGMDQSYLAGLEAGRRSLPREKQLLRLANALQVTDQECQELREARAFSKLTSLVEELGHERGAALTSVVSALKRLSADEIKILEQMAFLLEGRSSTDRKGGSAM